MTSRNKNAAGFVNPAAFYFLRCTTQLGRCNGCAVSMYDLLLTGEDFPAVGIHKNLQPVNVVVSVLLVSPNVSTRVKLSSRWPCAFREGLSIRK